MIAILPVGMDYRTRRYPVVTFTIMGVCTVFFMVLWLWQHTGEDADTILQWQMDHLWLTPSKSYWWTYFTHMFVHGGFMHLIGNMIYFFLFGACVEDMIGRWRFILFYLVCGLGAAMAHILFSPAHFATDIPMGGASGAISGCIGGYLFLRASAKIHFKYFVLFFFRFFQGDFSLPAWLVISFWFLKDFAYMMLVNSLSKHGGGGVAFGAHVGGTLVGAAWIGIEKLCGTQFETPEEEVEALPNPLRRVEMPTHMAPRPHTEARVIPLRPVPASSVGVPAQPLAPVVEAVPVAMETPNIHLSWDGAQSGPFTRTHVQQMFATGEIPATAYYWKEGMADWRSAEELRQADVT